MKLGRSKTKQQQQKQGHESKKVTVQERYKKE
jgi:hypothetical protein